MAALFFWEAIEESLMSRAYHSQMAIDRSIASHMHAARRARYHVHVEYALMSLVVILVQLIAS
jgi:hypothetical protein